MTSKKPIRIYCGTRYLGVKYVAESLLSHKFIRLPVTINDPFYSAINPEELKPIPTIYAEQIRPGVFITDDPVTADQLDINPSDTLFEDFADTMKETSTPPILRLTLCCIRELRERGALVSLLIEMRKETK